VSRVPGQPDKALMTRQPAGNVVRTTLSRPVQAAAARALDGTENSAIVVLKPDTGEILALADRLKDSYSAVLDTFPPGSTFKTITAAALLAHGLGTSDEVACPSSYAPSSGYPYTNDGDMERGTVTFADAYAYSCNTTFIEQATNRLTMKDLRDTADEWGFERPMATGVGGKCGTMEDTDDVDMLALNSIGQGTVEATPLCMAAVAAAVQNGTWRSPRLLPKDEVSRIDGEPFPDVSLDEGVVGALREMMAAVVDHGTASEAGLPEGVAGKTGTAEVLDEQSHGWFIGYSEDLAFCVFVKNGGSGRSAAVPIAARFLNGL
jgi:cell division protein FtsI/penicillin-binding protein 2